jgi:heme exporter protein D
LLHLYACIYFSVLGDLFFFSGSVDLKIMECFTVTVIAKVILMVLQYQRQVALQRIQEQEREMQMRQEQQKQQYLMGSSIAYSMQPPYMPG